MKRRSAGPFTAAEINEQAKLRMQTMHSFTRPMDARSTMMGEVQPLPTINWNWHSKGRLS